MTVRILSVVSYGHDQQALLLSRDDGSDDRYVIGAPRIDADDTDQLLAAYTALLAADPTLPESWTGAEVVHHLLPDSQPRITASLRGC